jgi:hypothetical protein
MLSKLEKVNASDGTTASQLRKGSDRKKTSFIPLPVVDP